MTKQKRTVTGIALTVVIALIGFGFTAMSINPPFTVPIWLPMLFFIFAGAVAIAVLSYLLWAQLKRIQFRFPIYLKSQQSIAVMAMAPVKAPPPRRLEHDGVLWEDGGRDAWGSVYVIGPLCPKDYTPLSTKHHDKIEAHLTYDTFISSSVYHSRLVCLECHSEYTLGDNPKQIQASHDEVAVRIIGMRKRELGRKQGEH